MSEWKKTAGAVICGLLLAFALCLGAGAEKQTAKLPALQSEAADMLSAAGNSCGIQLNWTFSGGILTVTGTGAMENYTKTAPAPWNTFRENITGVILGEGVTTVGSCAFYGCNNLLTVSLPVTLTSVGEGSFAGCSVLEQIDLGENTEILGAGAFEDCSALREAELGGKLLQIGDSAFLACNHLQSVQLPAALQTVGEQAFRYCAALKNIIIPASVRELQGNCFSDCTSLEEITISGSTTVGCEAFLNCTALREITVADQPVKLQDGAFRGCTALEAFSGSEYITELGTCTFAGCTSLQRFSFGAALTEIPGGAFYGCTSLSQVTFGEDLQTVCGAAFGNCESLQELLFPNNLKTLGDCAFYNCGKLTRLRIPAGLQTIGRGVLYGECRIRYVEYCGTAEQWDEIQIGTHNPYCDSATLVFINAITVEKPAGGTVSVSQTYPQNGDTVALTYTPEAGYKFLRFIVDGVPTEESTFTATGSHTVSAEVTKLKTVEMVSLPENLLYSDTAEALDLSGGLVKLTYENGDTEERALTAEMVSGYHFDISGTQNVTVNIAECTDTFPIFVRKTGEKTILFSQAAGEKCFAALYDADGKLLLVRQVECADGFAALTVSEKLYNAMAQAKLFALDGAYGPVARAKVATQ